MAGIDAIRGIAFQQAQALADIVEMVGNGVGETLRVEGIENIVDYEVLDRNGHRLLVRQAKTRQEPGTWGASEIAEVLWAWEAIGAPDGVAFAFVTDSQLSPSGQQLRALLDMAKQGASDAVIRAAAAGIGKSGVKLPPARVLRRADIITRAGTTEQILERVEYRVLRLLQRRQKAKAQDAQAAVDRLFRRLFEIGGGKRAGRREVSRADVLDALGLSEADIADHRSGAEHWQRTGSGDNLHPVSVNPEAVALQPIGGSGDMPASSGCSVWRVSDFPPSTAGVHRAISGTRDNLVPEDRWPTQDEWDRPLYVTRDHDERLLRRLRDAAARGYGFVLLTGDSSTGKTRSAWEAIHAYFESWQLIHPRDASSVQALPDSGLVHDKTIIWLDDTQQYLTANGHGGLSAHDLLCLFKQPVPAVAVGTMWASEYDRFTARSRLQTDLFSHARALLELAGDPIRVPPRMGGRELDRARDAAARDRRLADALDDSTYGVTQMLAGAPWLVHKWGQPRFPYTRPLITAAIDAQRLGIRTPPDDRPPAGRHPRLLRWHSPPSSRVV